MRNARTVAGRQFGRGAKPTVESLGIDVSAQNWQRSGSGNGAIEVAVVGSAPAAGGAAPIGSPGAIGSPGVIGSPGAMDGARAAEWVLMRVCGDPAGRVLVYDRHEWECFLDGVRGGEFDAAAS